MSEADNNGDQPVTEVGAALHGALMGALGPIREQLRVVDAEIESHEAALRELRQMRNEATRVLKVLDPDSVPKPKPRKAQGASGRGFSISEDKVASLETFLRERITDGRAFTGTEVFELPGGAALMGRSTLAVGLNRLVETGVLRLDAVAGGASGNAKVFKLVT